MPCTALPSSSLWFSCNPAHGSAQSKEGRAWPGRPLWSCNAALRPCAGRPPVAPANYSDACTCMLRAQLPACACLHFELTQPSHARNSRVIPWPCPAEREPPQSSPKPGATKQQICFTFDLLPTLPKWHLSRNRAKRRLLHHGIPSSRLMKATIQASSAPDLFVSQTNLTAYGASKLQSGASSASQSP